jgi:hypothetical protein
VNDDWGYDPSSIKSPGYRQLILTLVSRKQGVYIVGWGKVRNVAHILKSLHVFIRRSPCRNDSKGTLRKTSYKKASRILC